MRKTTLLWLCLAVFCAMALFKTSQQVQDGRQHLALITEKTAREEESIRVMQAEWSYLNHPDRLEKLAREHLNLVPMNGRQFARIEDLPQAPAEKPADETPVAEKAEEKKTETKKEEVVFKQPVTPPAKTPVAAKKAPAAEKKKATASNAAYSPYKGAYSPPKNSAWKPPVNTAKPLAVPQTPAQKRRSFDDMLQSLGTP